ncbi:TonB family protein [Arcicella sp. DC2W]|uniref:TonB family protein n=1 Tax=Arcicella gelida TaxID=2984195 RepID=A0ABU5S407_9BACT|nr:TonB family protein [Arcicella sp. DC2W]MEA5403145.1 TonB family protein [Arcicella sp. DC2W]
MNWLSYLLQVNLYLILFYGFYRLLLRTETFFNLNRGYLVASAALAFFVPLMQSEWVRSWFVTEQVSQTFSTFYSPTTFYVTAQSATKGSLTVGDMFAFAYIVGIILGVCRFGGNLAYLGKMMKKKVSGEKNQRAFSFFNMVFVSKELKNRSTIMKHEFVHIRQLHSADIMLFELIAIFNWFNPIVYLYKSSIKQIHEFIADEVASRHEASKADYAMLLFQEQFGVQAIPLTNNFFNKSLLKLRIDMLQKQRSTRTALLKYGLTAPLFMIMIVVSSATLASKSIAKIEDNISEVSQTDISAVRISSTKSARQVLSENGIDLSDALIISPALAKELSEGSTNEQVLKKSLQRVLLYPSIAIRNLIVGKVQVGFTVSPSGNIENIKILDAKEERSILAEEVIRSLNSIKKLKESGQSENLMLAVNFGLEVKKDNVTQELLLNEPSKEFKGWKKLDEIIVMGYSNSEARSIQKDTIEVFKAVDQQAEFPGGMDAFAKYLQSNLRYPLEAQNAKASGKVYIQFTVTREGRTADFSVLKGAGYGMDEEAVRVLKTIPQWTAGVHKGQKVNSRFTVPINFVLNNIQTGDNEVIERSFSKTTIWTDKKQEEWKNKPQPMYILDGVETSSLKLEKIDPNTIEKIDVLKDEKAIMRYGEKAKNGVIIITSKKK